MKSYKIHYTKASGLTQVGLLEAHCYALKDGFIQFYRNEEDYIKCYSFKSINSIAVLYVGEQE